MECQVRDITMYYEEVGAGRPLLLLHGWPLDHRHIANDMEPLFADRIRWRRLCPDLPGMGRTRAADWITCQDQMLDLVIDFIDTVAPGERFVVAGTSYGAYLARGLVHHRGAQIDGLLWKNTRPQRTSRSRSNPDPHPPPKGAMHAQQLVA